MNGQCIFTIAWDFYPNNSGESIVCKNMLDYSQFNFVIMSHSRLGDEIAITNNQLIYYFYGGYLRFIIMSLKTFFILDKDMNFKVLHTRVLPPVGHLVGVFIKVIKPKIKWLVYFSDPQWNSPYNSGWENSVFSKHFYLSILFNTFSKLALKLSDINIFNNAYLENYIVKNKRIKDKSRIIPYGFDNRLINDMDRCNYNNKHIVISHVGNIYGLRNFDVIIEALDLLRESHVEYYNNLKIKQVGNVENTIKSKVLNSTVYDKFEFIESVPHSESIHLMMESDILLIIDAKLQKGLSNIYIPSKIFDYLMVRKPIIAISDIQGPTADIIYETGNTLIEHSPFDLYKHLIKINCEPDSTVAHYTDLDTYSAKHGAQIFDSIVSSISILNTRV